MYAIEIENVSKKFKKNIIFEQVNMKIKEGTIVGLVGENGVGKSVLFKMICGFSSIDDGSIKVFGKDIGIDIDIPEDTGVIIETPGFLEEYDQMYNLKYLAAIRNRISENDILETLKKVGLNSENRQKVKKFSLGMRQKLALAQAIMEKPKLLILDEPMNGLDEQSVKKIREVLLDLKEQGTTILFASHMREDMEILCDEIYRIEQYQIKKV